MIDEEAIHLLQQHQLWRRGLPPYDETGGAPYTPKELGVAIDIAIKALDVQPTLIEALKACMWYLRDAYNNVSDGDEEYELIEEARAALVQHKLAWGLANFLAENFDGFHDKEHAMDVLKVEAKHIDIITNPKTGEVTVKPKSIAFASLPQMDFNRIFNRFVWIVVTDFMPNLQVEALKEHLNQMLAGKRKQAA